jgi:hypothetical protein
MIQYYIYTFYSQSQPIYIGFTTDLDSLTNHTVAPLSTSLKTTKVLDKYSALKERKSLIRQFRPIYNTTHRTDLACPLTERKKLTISEEQQEAVAFWTKINLTISRNIKRKVK